MTEIKFGLDTFGDMTVDDNGKPKSAGQVIRDLVDQAVLADELGLNSINVGEHTAMTSQSQHPTQSWPVLQPSPRTSNSAPV